MNPTILEGICREVLIAEVEETAHQMIDGAIRGRVIVPFA